MGEESGKYEVRESHWRVTRLLNGADNGSSGGGEEITPVAESSIKALDFSVDGL